MIINGCEILSVKLLLNFLSIFKLIFIIAVVLFGIQEVRLGVMNGVSLFKVDSLACDLKFLNP